MARWAAALRGGRILLALALLCAIPRLAVPPGLRFSARPALTPPGRGAASLEPRPTRLGWLAAPQPDSSPLEDAAASVRPHLYREPPPAPAPARPPGGGPGWLRGLHALPGGAGVWALGWALVMAAGVAGRQPPAAGAGPAAAVAVAPMSGEALDPQSEGLDVVQDVLPVLPKEPSVSWRLLDRWHTKLPALRPSYEDKLYVRQRRVNPDIDPGPFTWIRLRHVTWALCCFAAYGVCLNALIYLVLTHIHRTFPLGHLQQEHIASGFQRAMALVRYDQIMGRGPDLSSADAVARVQLLMQHFEGVEQRRLLHVIANRLSDSLLLGTVLGTVLWFWGSLRFLWGQVRLLVRLNIRTPVRAMGLLFLSDVLLGFHSNELWILLLTSIGERYGLNVGAGHWVNLVKATVPVAVDVGFKFVVFFYMQRKTQVIMREMNDF